jgi:hypothetical protein
MPKPATSRPAPSQRSKPKAPVSSSGPKTAAQKGLGKGPRTAPQRRGGIDVGKFAGEVSRNYASGAAALGRAKDETIRNVGNAIKNRPVLTPPSYKEATERAKRLQKSR